MAESIEAIFAKQGVADIGFGDSTTTFTQADRLQTDGTTADTPAQYVDSAVIPASTVAKNLFSLTGTKDLDDLFTEIAGGSFIATATTAAAGITKVDNDSAGDPVAVTVAGAGARIPTTAQDAALDALTGTDAASASNYYLTRSWALRQMALGFGSGKDGNGKLGAIASSSTAPASLDVTAAGLLTGTFTWKIAAYNLSGEIVASSASASSGAITSKQATFTLPILPTNAMGWNVYRSTNGVNWYWVGRAVDGVDGYDGSGTDTYTDNNPYPNTSLSAPGSDTTGTTATLSGRWEFTDFTMGASDTINVANSGATAGNLEILWQGTATIPSGAAIVGTGANRVLISRHELGYGPTDMASDGLVAHKKDVATFGPTAASAHLVASAQVPIGLGADISNASRNLAGFGTKGSAAAGTGGDGGWGGSRIRLWGYRFANNVCTATITNDGQAGTAGSGTAAAGGGGGAGGITDNGAYLPWKDAGTTYCRGGAAGAHSSSGGASTIPVSPGGGGGLIIRRNCQDTSSATESVAAGAANTQVTNASANVTGRTWSGAHYGDAGSGGVSGGSTYNPTAGQIVALNGKQFPGEMFA